MNKNSQKSENNLVLFQISHLSYLSTRFVQVGVKRTLQVSSASFMIRLILNLKKKEKSFCATNALKLL